MPRHPRATSTYFWHGQVLHAVLLMVLLATAWVLVDVSPLSSRTFLGVGADDWFVLCLAIPIVHQVFVWITWRSELCSGTWTRLLGRSAFPIYVVIFFILFWARPIALMGLAVADYESLSITIAVRTAMCVTLAVPTLYASYSVARYFGMIRATGADHFDERYRCLPLVDEGIFKYTRNGMYKVVFLVFWLIAIAGASWSAIVAAGFCHAYIWVHFYCTEQPDMELIYAAPIEGQENVDYTKATD